jgi:geranylgeranyl diphosphate synthase type I
VTTAPPPSLAPIATAVGRRIETLLEAEQARWAAIDPALEEAYLALRAIIAGGKKLRPAFCHWAWVGAGGDPDATSIVDAGAALELLHTFALIHDDIMDDANLRHGLTCVHVDFAARHRQRQWQGESRRFGDGAAILIGDVAFVYADQLLQGAPAAAQQVFTELRLEVNVGQYLDLLGTATRHPTVEQARTIAVYKSGKYTFERPLHLGAALAGRLAELQQPLTRFGVPLGEAFQLRDDLLDVFGDSAVLGKPVGQDLRSGKPTCLLAIGLARASDAEAKTLASGDPDAMREVLVKTGAREEVEERIDRLRAAALDALAEAPIEESAHRELQALAMFVSARQH